ncbi:MAG: type III pantothenate kinase [Arenimonas sp.]
MSLLLDCGNTRCKITRVLEDGSLAPVLAIAIDADDFLSQLQHRLGSDIGNKRAYLASVVSEAITSRIESALQTAGFSVIRVKTQSEALGVRIAYPIPQQLGVDRFLALLAAHQRHESLLLVSAGSALTVDVLAANGQHHGGMITATETIINAAMETRFVNFRNLSGQPVGFSSNTGDALASGARYMVLGIIEKSWREASALLNEPDLPILITGGDAKALLPHLRDNVSHQPTLVLEGLALWADYLESV